MNSIFQKFKLPSLLSCLVSGGGYNKKQREKRLRKEKRKRLRRMKRKSLNEKMKSRSDALTHREENLQYKEDDITHREENLGRLELSLGKKFERIKEKENDLEAKLSTLKEKENLLESDEKRLDSEKRQMLVDKDSLQTLKDEIEKTRTDISQQESKIQEGIRKLKISEEERAEYNRLEEICRSENQYPCVETSGSAKGPINIEKMESKMDVNKPETVQNHALVSSQVIAAEKDNSTRPADESEGKWSILKRTRNYFFPT